MTVLSAQSIRARVGMIEPFAERTIEHGVSYGLSPSGYDIRIRQAVRLWPGDFVLASTVERFCIPDDLMAICHDKSTWARMGLSVFNTVLESGWSGHLTLELSLSRGATEPVKIPSGAAIGQLVFHRLDAPTEQPYRGKYQGQADAPVPAIMQAALRPLACRCPEGHCQRGTSDPSACPHRGAAEALSISEVK